MGKKFAVTFGMKYNAYDCAHPTHKCITGRHYVVIDAASELEARYIVINKFDRNWAFIYEMNEDFDRQIEKYDLIEFRSEDYPLVNANEAL